MNHYCCTGTHTPRPKRKEPTLSSLIVFFYFFIFFIVILSWLFFFFFFFLVTLFVLSLLVLLLFLCTLLFKPQWNSEIIKYNLLILKLIIVMITTPITFPNTVNLASFNCNGQRLVKKRLKRFQNLKKLKFNTFSSGNPLYKQ